MNSVVRRAATGTEVSPLHFSVETSQIFPFSSRKRIKSWPLAPWRSPCPWQFVALHRPRGRPPDWPRGHRPKRNREQFDHNLNSFIYFLLPRLQFLHLSSTDVHLGVGRLGGVPVAEVGRPVGVIPRHVDGRRCEAAGRTVGYWSGSWNWENWWKQRERKEEEESGRMKHREPGTPFFQRRQ